MSRYSFPKMIIYLACFLLLVSACIPAMPGEELPVVLRFSAWSGAEPIYKAWIEGYEEQHPNVTIQLETAPWGEYQTKTQTQMAANEAPDVMLFHTSYVYPFADRGVFLALQPYVEQTPNYDVDDFYPFASDAGIWRETRFGVPFEVDPKVLVFNKDLFDAAGVEYPSSTDPMTWDEFLETAQQVTDLDWDVPRFGYAEESLNDFVTWVAQSGVELFSPPREPLSCRTDNPASVQAMEFYFGLSLEHHVSPTAAERRGGLDTSGHFFTSGQVAMYLASPYLFPSFEAARMNYGVAPRPKGQVRANQVHVYLLTINAKTEHPGEAWDFIAYLTDRQGALSVAEYQLGVPARVSAVTSDAFLSNNPLARQVISDELEFGYVALMSERSPDIYQQMIPIVDQISLGTLSVRAGAEQIAQSVNQLLGAQ